MDTTLDLVSSHMLNLGLGALAHANWHSSYFSFANNMWAELSVLQAAHAAEILIKARIAEEHPLLIFDQLPRDTQKDGNTLELRHLFEKGRTVQYSDLPDRLWAVTGIRLPNVDVFNNFGKLRNTIQHFAAPSDRNFRQEAIEFIYKVIDPFINQCWNLYAIDYDEDHEPYVYLVSGLIRRGIYFLVSPEAINNLKFIELDWPEDNAEYQIEMEQRLGLRPKTDSVAEV